MLGRDFGGVLVRDDWAPYRRFRAAVHQTCLAHLLRGCRELRVDHPRSPILVEVQRVPHAALALRDWQRAGTVSAQGLAVARGRLIARLGDTVTRVYARPHGDAIDPAPRPRA